MSEVDSERNANAPQVQDKPRDPAMHERLASSWRSFYTCFLFGVTLRSQREFIVNNLSGSREDVRVYVRRRTNIYLPRENVRESTDDETYRAVYAYLLILFFETRDKIERGFLKQIRNFLMSHSRYIKKCVKNCSKKKSLLAMRHFATVKGGGEGCVTISIGNELLFPESSRSVKSSTCLLPAEEEKKFKSILLSRRRNTRCEGIT